MLISGKSVTSGLSAALAAIIAASSPAPAQTLFRQPQITLGNSFAVGRPKLPGTFGMVQWQPNPLTVDHQDVPVSWNMNAATGLAVPPPMDASQAGTRNRVNATGIQIYNGEIGINLNSKDFSPTGTLGNLVAIMPNILFADASIRPFATPGRTLVYSLQLQVPTAVVTPPANNPGYKGNPYIGMDMLFQDMSHPNSPQVSVTVNTFALHRAPPENIGFTTQGGGRILIKTGLVPGNLFSTLMPGSTAYQGATWRGYKPFSVGITDANFAAGIAAIQSNAVLLTGLGITAADYSANLADWALLGFHLNAELNYAAGLPIYTGGSVRMGLAVKDISLILQ
jgi:hypothetical protein